jgi:hypothetical protein
MTANPADFPELNHCLMALDWHAASAPETPDRHGEPEKTAKTQKANRKRLAFLNFWSGRWESNSYIVRRFLLCE